MFLYQPPKPASKHTARRASTGLGQDKNTMEHLENSWVPVNPSILKNIQQRLEEGYYKDIPSALVDDLKADPSLFFHCVKELSHSVDSGHHGINPIAALEQLEEEKLSEILGTPISKISKHTFKHATKPQAKQLQFSIASNQAAEEIAKQVALPPDMAFSSSNLRQLGLYLISWNYPRIYSRVLTNHRKDGADIDFELHRLLGLTPKQVGARLAQKWRLDPQLIKPLGSAADDVTVRAREKNESEFTMNDVCEVSELYAKTKDPDTYPEAEELWSTNEDAIIQVIGEETFQRIEEKVEETVELYVDVSDVIKKLPILGGVYDQSPKDLPAHSGKNSYLERCPKELQSLFEEVYNTLDQARVSVDAMRILVDNVIPKAGFVRGCLFLLDAKTMDLKPALRIGDVPLSAYQKLVDPRVSEVWSALQGLVPMKVSGIGITGKPTTHVCGDLKNLHHPGVLYLEVDPHDDEDGSLDYFHAIRQTINHCFGSQ